MQNWENINHETVDGFGIYFDVAPEYDQPDWDMTDEERTELLRKIDNGLLAWFIARVRAEKNNVKLAETYLGGCCYESPRQFMDGDGYYADMVQEVITESRKMIASLVEV